MCSTENACSSQCASPCAQGPHPGPPTGRRQPGRRSRGGRRGTRALALDGKPRELKGEVVYWWQRCSRCDTRLHHTLARINHLNQRQYP